MREDQMKLTLGIPRGLYERLEKVLEEGQEMEDVIIDLIRKYVSEKEVADSSYSPEEEEEIRKRLKDLGYIE